MDRVANYRRNENAIATLAKNIRKYRKVRNLTQTELAGMLNMDFAQIGKIERQLVNTSVSLIFDIAAALQIKPSQLLEE